VTTTLQLPVVDHHLPQAAVTLAALNTRGSQRGRTGLAAIQSVVSNKVLTLLKYVYLLLNLCTFGLLVLHTCCSVSFSLPGWLGS
jgi:hypothetical protein